MRTRKLLLAWLSVGVALAAAIAMTGCARPVAQTKKTPLGSPVGTATPPATAPTSTPVTLAPGLEVEAPDSSGLSRYTDTMAHFSFRFPASWSVTRAKSATDSGYPTVTMSSGAEGVGPVVLQVVGNPEKFSAEAVMRNKWSGEKGVTLTTSTADGKTVAEAWVETRSSRGKRGFVYEAAVDAEGPVFVIVRFEGADRQALEAVAAEAKKTLVSFAPQ